MYQFKTRRKVEFADTDLAGIASFSRFFVYMQNAEHEFHNALGASVTKEIDGDVIGWPRISSHCEFFQPARFEDELEITVLVLRKGKSSATFGFLIHRQDVLLARGQLTSVCCKTPPHGKIEPIPFPEPWASRMQEAPPELSEEVTTPLPVPKP